MKCTECDEGYVEKDRSYGDYMMAVKVECPCCNGTTVRLCCDCESRNAVKLDEYSDPVCDECAP